MRLSGAAFLCCLLPLGCGLTSPLRTQSKVNMTVDRQVEAKVDASIYTLPDTGPILEVPVATLGQQPASCKVAIIDVDGLLLNGDTVGPYSLGDNPVAVFEERLAAAAADPAVKAVVLRINSPGGSTAATEMMGRSLTDFRRRTGKPVVACLLDQGTGGAYYLACLCDQIVAMRSSVIGGVGVILNLFNLELAMEQFNLFGVPIKAGERIDMGTPTRKISAEEKTLLTAMAKEYHGNFIQIVHEGRPKVKADASIFDGRVVSASKALEENLIDRMGMLPDALDLARQLGGGETMTAVMYRRRGSPARSVYETVPNKPMQVGTLSLNVPGLDRSRLPLFLYVWQIEPTLANK